MRERVREECVMEGEDPVDSTPAGLVKGELVKRLNELHLMNEGVITCEGGDLGEQRAVW